MSLSPSARLPQRPGRALGAPSDARRARATRSIAEVAGMTTTVASSPPSACAASHAAGRQVDLPPRRDPRRDGRRARAGAQLPDAADTTSTLDAMRALGALVEVARRRRRRSAAPACATRAELARPIDVGNAGTLMRLLPGWLAAQEGRSYTLDGDASIRRAPGRPHRRAAAARWARRSTRPTGASRRSPSPARGCARSTTSCRSPARRSSPACCSPG